MFVTVGINVSTVATLLVSANNGTTLVFVPVVFVWIQALNLVQLGFFVLS